MKKRPFLVTIMGALMILGGIVQAVMGVVVAAKHRDAKFLADAHHITANQALTAGVVLIAMGAISFLLGLGLLKGSRFVRFLIGLFELVQIAGGIYAIAKLDTTQRANGVGTIVVALIVLYVLYGTNKAKGFFGAGAD